MDITEGLTDEQAGKIAAHLKLDEEGPSYEAVRLFTLTSS